MDEYDPLEPPTYDPTTIPLDTGDDTQKSNGTDLVQSQPTSRIGSAIPEPSAQPSRPLTQAGFLVESSDEEGSAEDEVVINTNGVSGEQSDAVAQVQDVSIGSAPTQDTTSAAPSVQQIVSPNGSTAPAASLNAPLSTDVPSTSVPIVSITSVTPIPAVTTPASNGLTASVQANSQRLAHDKVGQLEDRLSDEPRADPNAWLALIQHYRDKDQLDNVRKAYDRFLEVYPTSATIWLAYLNFEQEQDDHARIDVLLNRALLKVLNVDLWLFYLNVLRRRHPLISDDGKNRAIITQAFDFVLKNIGLDPDAGQLWRDYIDFIKSGPGNVSTTSNHWQDQQKADLLRKAYQQAVTLPNDEVSRLWKEYDTFEHTWNRAAARKFIQERSPHYMTAKVAKSQLDERIQGLDRKSIPRLPPLPGFSGDVEFGQQVQKWTDWIEWEKTDELVLKQEDDLEEYRKRVNYAYKQATMSLRFYPTIWFDAATWCYQQGTETWRKEAETYLDGGITANPESALLILRKADMVEASFRGKGDSDEIVVGNGNVLDAVYEKAHKALYTLKKKYQEREDKALVDLQAYYDGLPPEEDVQPIADDDDDAAQVSRPKNRQQQHAEHIALIKAATVSRQDTLKRTISYVWIAKMRAFRRIQGQGKPKEAKKGFRGVFAEARPRGSITWDVYVAAALMEYHCYADIVATKIFERGFKLYPTDEHFVIENIKYFVSRNDLINARSLYKEAFSKIEKSGEFNLEQRREKCRPLLVYMYHIESNYGDLRDIQDIEKRMSEMYPDEPEISRFAQRFQQPSFDATRTLLAISPLQTQPKMPQDFTTTQPVQSIEEVKASPQPGQIMLGPHGPYVASPKRPLEDSDNDTPSRKFLRGDSPLKGAAGRRIATATGAAMTVTNTSGSGGFVTKSYVPGATAPAPAPLPAAINYILSILPPASSYQATKFDPQKMVDFIRTIDLSRFAVQ